MFKSIYKALTETPPTIDPISSMVSNAKQASEVAVARLNRVLCSTLDGPGCECRTLKIAGDKQ